MISGRGAGPVAFRFGGDEAAGVVRIAVAEVIPARTGPLGHGVGFAGGAVGEIDPIGGLAEQRIGSGGASSGSSLSAMAWWWPSFQMIGNGSPQ